jgi:hypothetical protein
MQMDEPTFCLNDLLGHVQLVSVQERRGEKIYLGGYSIDYDYQGRERSRSEVRWNVVVDCGDVATAMGLDSQANRGGVK